MNGAYENRYIAFLDILGFKNMVYQSANNPQILNLINLALNYTRKVQLENYDGEMPMSDLGKQVSVFSDSIVISYEMKRPGSGFFVLLDLVYLCNDLLGVGIPVRGGVTVGQLIHENNKCFGPAMVEAYSMESDLAIYPRIIVDPKVIEYDLQHRGKNNTIEFEREFLNNLIDVDDVDKMIYLDYLSQYSEFNDLETYNVYINYVRNFINESLKIYCNNPQIAVKYEWLKKYYNKTMVKVFGESNPLLIL